MRKIVGLVLSLSSCATTAPSVKKSNKCPPAGTEVSIAKVMNPAIIADYQGCEVVVEAMFIKVGHGDYSIGSYDASANVVFQAADERQAPRKDTTIGPAFGVFCGVSNDKSDVLSSLQPTETIRMHGAPLAFYSGKKLISVVFQARSIERRAK